MLGNLLSPVTGLLGALGNKVAVWAGAGLLALILLWAGVSHYTGLVRERDALSTSVQTLQSQHAALLRGIDALETELDASLARASRTNSIKQEVYASPSGTVPPDIRAALERLRNDKH